MNGIQGGAVALSASRNDLNEPSIDMTCSNSCNVLVCLLLNLALVNFNLSTAELLMADTNAESRWKLFNSLNFYQRRVIGKLKRLRINKGNENKYSSNVYYLLHHFGTFSNIIFHNNHGSKSI